MKTLLFFSLIFFIFSCSGPTSQKEQKPKVISEKNLNFKGVINGLFIDSIYTDSLLRFHNETEVLKSDIEIKTHQNKITKINFSVSFNNKVDKEFYKVELVKHYQKLFGEFTLSKKLHCWISNYRNQKRLQILLMDTSEEEKYKIEVIAGPRAQL